jgi:uncharacterized repeat protein (TIGR01451 family)
LLKTFMKNLTTIIATSLILGFLIASNATSAFADCQAIYGGSQNCTTSYTFTVQKLVQVPGKSGGSYVNNLSINDAKYAPNQTVNFQVNVKNTSSQTIPTITVKDIFPQYLSFVSGAGSFDTNSNTLTFTVSNLGAGETKTFNLVGKVADATTLPSDQGVVCLINQANGTDNNGAVNASSSQFCVEKAVLGTSFPVVTTKGGITTTPATGPEMLPLMALIPGGLAGFILRKKSIKK